MGQSAARIGRSVRRGVVSVGIMVICKPFDPADTMLIPEQSPLRAAMLTLPAFILSVEIA